MEAVRKLIDGHIVRLLHVARLSSADILPLTVRLNVFYPDLFSLPFWCGRTFKVNVWPIGSCRRVSF